MKDPFIQVYPNNLTKTECQEIIRRYEVSDKKYQGVTMGGLNLNAKKTMDLRLSIYEDWKDIDKILYERLTPALESYGAYVRSHNASIFLPDLDITDSGYMIMKYDKQDGYYSWHDDSAIEARFVTYLWYLNDVKEGGQTVFKTQSIKPKAGTLVLFPATWTYVHKAEVPISCDKYIVTGWVTRKKKPAAPSL